MHDYRYFECCSCTYLVKIPAETKSILWCPLCRGALTEIPAPEGVNWTEELTCEECGSLFASAEGAKPPYKCINCNYSFQANPRKLSNERL